MGNPTRTEYTALISLLRRAGGEGRERGAAAGPLPAFSPPGLAMLARYHGVAPLAARGLKCLPGSSPAAEALAQLAPFLAHSTRKSLLLSAELLAILELLRGHGIDVLPYKGPVLAQLLYGSAEMRVCRDLDLLIPRHHLLKAAELLAARGYRPLDGLSPPQMAALLETGYHHQLERETDGILLELHWRVANGYFATLDDAGMWERSRETPFLGRAVPTLATTDLLICLAVHGARHHWDRLSHVIDFAVLVDILPAEQWEEVERMARASGTARRLAVALLLAERMLASESAQTALVQMGADPRARWLAAHFAGRLEEFPIEPYGLFQHARLDLVGMDRFRDRARYCRGAMAPNVPDWTDSRLPPALSALAAVLRPVRLLRAHGLFDRKSRR